MVHQASGAYTKTTEDDIERPGVSAGQKASVTNDVASSMANEGLIKDAKVSNEMGLKAEQGHETAITSIPVHPTHNEELGKCVDKQVMVAPLVHEFETKAAPGTTPSNIAVSHTPSKELEEGIGKQAMVAPHIHRFERKAASGINPSQIQLEEDKNCICYLRTTCGKACFCKFRCTCR